MTLLEAPAEVNQEPMQSLSLGAELRRLRIACGFGLNEAAGRSQISKAALSQWESGARTPSGQALDRLLTTLRAEPRLRARLLTEADPAYARNALTGEPMGSMVDLGQVLRGMRLRSGHTQSEVASLCSVAQSSVAAWESGGSVPSEELLQMALKALNARQDEIEIIGRSRNLRSEIAATDDLSARLMALLDPRLPCEIREPLIILLQRDAWHAAQHDRSAEELLCEITTWRSAWYRQTGRTEEGIVHARQALRHAKALGNPDLGAHAFYYLVELQRLTNGAQEHRRMLAAASKWIERPLDPFRRAQVLLACGELAFWGRLPKVGIEMASEARELLSDYRASQHLYPFYGVEDAIGMIAKCQMLRDTDKVIPTLQTIPDFKDRGPFGSAATVNAYLLTLPDLDEEPSKEALPAVRRILEKGVKVHTDYWRQWERFLVRRQQGIYCDFPSVWPSFWNLD